SRFPVRVADAADRIGDLEAAVAGLSQPPLRTHRVRRSASLRSASTSTPPRPADLREAQEVQGGAGLLREVAGGRGPRARARPSADQADPHGRQSGPVIGLIYASSSRSLAAVGLGLSFCG